MKSKLSAFVLWLLVLALPVNAVAARLVCCKAQESALAAQAHGQGHCPMHHAGKAGDASDQAHRPATDHCRHCAACCAPLPMVANAPALLPTPGMPEHPDPAGLQSFNSLFVEALERPPKHSS